MKYLSKKLKKSRIIQIIILILIFCQQITQAQDAQQPSIMIIPSDNQLLRLGCLDTIDSSRGKIYYRNYQDAFIKDASLKFVISGIQGKFADRGFPLDDLEQTLKQITNENPINIADNVELDIRAEVLKAAQPDIILELTYELKSGGMGNVLVFNIAAKDAYTLKTIGTAVHPGIPTTQTNIETLMAEQVELNIQNLQSDMQRHFNDLVLKGREISLRVVTSADSGISLKDECGEEFDEHEYIIEQWVKKACKNFQFRRVRSSASEILFADVRIELFDKDGIPIGAYDWVRELRKHLARTCGLDTEDITVGLGGAALLITGLR